MIRWLLLLCIPVTGLVACKADKRTAAEDPVAWTVADAADHLRPGSVDTLRLAAAIDQGWYIYSLTQKTGGPTPMTISVAPSPPFRVEGSVIGPQPVVTFDKEFGIETERYEGTPDFMIPVAVAVTSDARPQSIEMKVRYQACNATLCLPARTKVLTTPMRIADPT
jgi:DsbC/DsbD-like thiol-disulfide interchange protein